MKETKVNMKNDVYEENRVKLEVVGLKDWCSNLRKKLRRSEDVAERLMQ